MRAAVSTLACIALVVVASAVGSLTERWLYREDLARCDVAGGALVRTLGTRGATCVAKAGQP